MKISGYLKTVRGLHIAAATDKNTTGVASEPILDLMTGRTQRVAFIPATVLRGKLRRVASDIADEQMQKHGVRIPLEVFNALRHGSNSGRMTNDPVAPAFFNAQKAHPIMGLFGGGPRQGAGGALRTAPLYPLTTETVAAGIVPADMAIENPPQAFVLTNEAFMYPRLDVMRDANPEFDAVVENLDEKIDEIIAADVARRVRKSGGEESSEPESTLRGSNLLAYKYMIPGVMLYLDFKVDPRAPDHVKGFFLETLVRMLNSNEIGGMQRIGIGADVFDLASAAAKIKLDGEPLFDWDGHKLSLNAGEAGRLQAAYELWNDGGKAWTSESLWDATGFTGIDLNDAAVKKTPKASKKPGKGAAK